MNWEIAAFLATAGLLIWFLYRGIKNNKQAFSRENMGKSALTLAKLALGLIVFIGLLVIFLRG